MRRVVDILWSVLAWAVMVGCVWCIFAVLFGYVVSVTIHGKRVFWVGHRNDEPQEFRDHP